MADAVAAWLRGESSLEARAGGVIVIDHFFSTRELLRTIAKLLGAK